MYRLSTATRLGIAGLMLALAVDHQAGAAPLPSKAAFDDQHVTRRASASELALRDPRLEFSDEAASGFQQQLLGTHTGRRPRPDVHSFDLGRGPDSAANPAGSSLHDVLRSFVNVRPDSAAARGGPPHARARAPADDTFDLGLASNEWIRDSVEEVLTSVLSLNVNERGQASFSVLGWGDFSVVISDDRSEIELRAGDEAIVIAERTAHGAQGSGAYPGGYAEHHPSFGGGTRRNGEQRGESPLRRAVELLVEVASHPISFLVYALIGGYALAWGLLAGRANRRLAATARHHRSRRSRSAAPPATAVIAAAAAPAEKRARKRIRVRVRVRKYRR